MIKSDSRITASTLQKERAYAPCSVILKDTNSGKTGEASIFVKPNCQTQFFCYRKLLINRHGKPIHWIIPVNYSNEQWELGLPYILHEQDRIQKKEIPDLDSKNKKKLAAIVDSLYKRLPKAKFNTRTIKPSTMPKLKKDFSQQYIDTIDKTYYRISMRLILPFNIQEH